MELRRLEDEVVLAELDWKIERDYDEEIGRFEIVDEIDKIYFNSFKVFFKDFELER